MTAAGGCLCGAVRYRLDKAPTAFGVCHCGMCRRWGGGVTMGVEVPPGGLTWQQGKDRIATYQSSDWAERGWCQACGGQLFWRMTADGPMHGMLSPAAPSLDRFDTLDFGAEIYIDAKPDSYAFAGDRPRITEAQLLASLDAGGAS